MPLTDNELVFLRWIKKRGARLCKTNPPADKLLSLVERGYCRLLDERLGPLAVQTGEVMIDLSEAGREIVELKGEV